MQRTDLLGVDPEIHRLKVRLLREKSPEWRLQRALELSRFLKEFVKASRQAYLEQKRSND